MESANRIGDEISTILKRNEQNTKQAIEELFIMIRSKADCPFEPPRFAILYCMEKLHEWENIMKYARKWNLGKFLSGFAVRMAKRVDEPEPRHDCANLFDELRRMIDKYWAIKGAKIP